MFYSEIVSAKVILNKLVTAVELNGNRFDISYWGAFDQHFGTKPHSHAFFEITLITKGDGQYIENGEEFILKKNSLIVTKPGQIHQIVSKSGLEMIYFAFSSDEVQVKLGEPVINLSSKDPLVLTWQSLIYTALIFQESNSEEPLSVIQLAKSLIQLVLDRSNSTRETSQMLVAITEQTELLNKIKKYIRENIEKKLSIESIADHFFISKRQVFRLFQKYESYTCNNYIKQVRINDAADLIKTTKMSITDISDKVGFSSVHYFSKVFKDEMRDTPQKFRLLYSNATVNKFNFKKV
ncbi:AraC family transcriptional regulator [Lactobacillus sp. LC28-10]|uniref:AraC family transcriptional regulator n=1 Tax=Secundilactobacillus angelensis TaxID=2722706 RepID=A0ABX1KZ85_9LACO|nr:AraC family transcriptional regulator [Secundilactobacillus angelensis]MCH5461751.1 AraC family transcriptional regulator [Secundilactobacillus angelensis]NLR18590.1 AraC family transcriptional regulator [Secundilactobacillus angelensis]